MEQNEEKKAEILAKVENVLDEVRIGLQSHGGDVELVEIEGDVAKVRLTGACQGCPMAKMTLAHGVEDAVVSKVPEITKVEAVLPAV